MQWLAYRPIVLKLPPGKLIPDVSNKAERLSRKTVKQSSQQEYRPTGYLILDSQALLYEM